MKLRFTLRATRNIHAIADYLQPHSLTGARHVSEALENGFAIIADYPNAGRRFKKDVRRPVLSDYPYLIYCRVHEKAGIVEIVAVRHAARPSADFRWARGSFPVSTPDGKAGG